MSHETRGRGRAFRDGGGAARDKVPVNAEQEYVVSQRMNCRSVKPVAAGSLRPAWQSQRARRCCYRAS